MYFLRDRGKDVKIGAKIVKESDMDAKTPFAVLN
jgi:hypothetical protein